MRTPCHTARGVLLLLVVVALGLGGVAPGFAQDDAAEAPNPFGPDSSSVRKHFGRAMGETFAVNLMVWAYDRYIRPVPEGTKQGEGFRISFNSWKENIKNGMEFDDNNFATNQFAHPYHGSLYFNAGRSNGYDFWESSAFTWMGSFMWEYFGETHHPAVNDWVSTSVGGTAMGEVLFRFSDMILDNTATGSNRTWRELGGAAVNPMRGFNRLVTGEAFRVHPNSPDRTPKNYYFALEGGLRTTGEEKIWEADTTRAYVNFDWRYGNPFEGEYSKPFSSFDFMLQINFREKSAIGVAAAKGLLWGTHLHESEVTDNILTAYQHYDYVENTAYEFGGQSFSLGFMTRIDSGTRFTTSATLHLNALLLGAVKGDYANSSGRAYDYGPGVGYKFNIMVRRDDRDFLTFAHSAFLIHSINGNVSDHIVAVTRVKMDIPVRGFFGLGIDYWLYNRESTYRDFEDVSRRFPEIRGYFSYAVN